jgi:hypothetical protein
MKALFSSLHRANVTAFVLLCACSPAARAPARAGANPPGSTRDAGSVAVAAPDASSPAAPRDPVADVVARWNDAHNRHDADALAALYAPTVSFYGADLGSAACVERKRAALAAARDYEQTLSALETSAPDGNDGVFVRFEKTTRSGGRAKTFAGYLYVVGGRIVAEGDRNPDGFGTRYTYCYGAGANGPDPNDARVGVFKVSALEAVVAVRWSKAFADLQAKSRARLEVSIRDCAHSCAPGDFGSCKDGDIVPYYVIVGVGQDDRAAFGVDPVTKKISPLKL